MQSRELLGLVSNDIDWNLLTVFSQEETFLLSETVCNTKVEEFDLPENEKESVTQQGEYPLHLYKDIGSGGWI